MHIKIYEKRPAKITRPPLFIKIYYYFEFFIYFVVVAVAAVAVYSLSLSVSSVPTNTEMPGLHMLMRFRPC